MEPQRPSPMPLPLDCSPPYGTVAVRRPPHNPVSRVRATDSWRKVLQVSGDLAKVAAVSSDPRLNNRLTPTNGGLRHFAVVAGPGGRMTRSATGGAFPSGASRYSGGHVQPRHRGDSRRDQQPHNDGRNCSRHHHHPRLRCRLHHARSKRPIRKAAISEIIRVAAALKPSTTSKIAARFPERQLSLRQEAPCLYG
jgi:hypothetical protein